MTRCKKIFVVLLITLLSSLCFFTFSTAYAYRTGDNTYTRLWTNQYTYSVNVPFTLQRFNTSTYKIDNYVGCTYPISITTNFLQWEFITYYRESAGGQYIESKYYVHTENEMRNLILTCDNELFSSNARTFIRPLNGDLAASFFSAILDFTSTYDRGEITDVEFYFSQTGNISTGAYFTLTYNFRSLDESLDNTIFTLDLQPYTPIYSPYNYIYSNIYKSGQDFPIYIYPEAGDFDIDAQYDKGFVAGRDVGYNLGYDDGYSLGYNRGVELATDGSFFNLFTSIGQGFLDIFYGMFDFNFLGINMLDFFRTLITLGICIAVIKFINIGV